MAFLIETVACSLNKPRSVTTRLQDLEITQANSYSFNTWTQGMDNNNENSLVHIDISGVHFVTYRDTLLKVPNTRLAALVSHQDENMTDKSRIFFDRNSFLFEYIIDFYRTGELHLPSGRCGLAIKSELAFWGLDETCISTCCWKTYTDSMEEITAQLRIREEFSRFAQNQERTEKNYSSRKKLWTFLEYPRSSKGAKVYSIISSLVVILSLGIEMLMTMPSFRVDLNTESDNVSSIKDISQLSTLNRMSRTRPIDALIYIDIMCVVSVSLELIIKLFVCPNRLSFLKSFSTFSDLLFVLPVGIIGLVEWAALNCSCSMNADVSIWLQSMALLRVLRLHRLARCIRGFVVLALSLKASAKELLLLMALALSASIVFAFAIFSAEMSQQDTFPHAFMGMWWSLITMTSVGYGDIYPKTPIGYIVGGVCAIAGIILISVPVPVIANNFNRYYSYRERGERKCHCIWNGKCSKADNVTRYKNDNSSAILTHTNIQT